MVSSTRAAFLGWLGFTLLLFYALALGGGWLGMYNGTIRLANLVILAIALPVWALVAWRRPAWRPTTAIWPAFVAPIGVFLLTSLLSEQRGIGLELTGYAVLLTALYLLLVRVMATSYARARIGGSMAAIALVLLLAYIALSVQLWIEWWGLIGELRMPPFRPALLGLTWGSPSVVFTVLALCCAVAIGGLGLATRGVRATAVLLALLLLIAAFISGARSGWLAIAGAVVIVGALALLDARGRDLLATARSNHRVRFAMLPVVILAAVVIVAIGPAILQRLFGEGDAGRLELWATAMRMFGEAPLLGTGPGTWMIRRVAYTEPGELDWYQPHAHSQYLQTAAEFGIVGLLAGLVAVGAVLWLLYRALRGEDRERRRWAWTSLFVVVYLGLNVAVDVHTIPTVALLLGLPIAVLDATSDRGIGLPAVPARTAHWLRAGAVALLVVVCAAAMVQLFRSEGTAMVHRDAIAAAEAGQWDEARDLALEAASREPRIGAFGMTAALTLAAEGDWDAAEEWYRRVTEVDQLPTAWLGLARSLAEQGSPAELVAKALAEAMRLGEQQPALALAAGQVYDMVGRAEDAEAAYAAALSAAPTLAADDAWQSELGSERSGRIAEQAMEFAPAEAWLIALAAGDAERAGSLAAEGYDPPYQQAFVDAWQGDPEAYEAVIELALATPESGTRVAGTAVLSDALGDAETATRFRRMMRIAPFYGPPSVRFGVGERQPEANAPTGVATYFYGTYTYRRALPLDLLPPGRLGLVVVSSVADDGAEPNQIAPQ